MARERAGEPLARQVAPSDRIGLAVIGAGGMGMAGVGTALRIPGVELVAACDIFDGRLDAARERHGDIFTSRDYREVLARDDVDAVIVGTPDHWHQPISVDALRAGKAAYCEKPMVHDVAEGHGPDPGPAGVRERLPGGQPGNELARQREGQGAL